MSEDAAAKRRARQTVINLGLSLAATLGIVLITVLGVPRDDSARHNPVDYVAEGQAATESSNLPILLPKLESGWWANNTRWTASAAAKDGVATWYAGFVGPKNQFIGITQAFGSNPTWLALQVATSVQKGTKTIGNIEWTLWQAAEPSDPPKTKDQIWSATLTRGGGEASESQDALLIYGTATEAEFEEFAKALSDSLGQGY